MRRFVCAIALVSTAACAGSPSGPSGQSERFTWTVNGTTYEASSNGRGALRSGSTVGLSGAACGSGAILGISIPSAGAPGTFNVSAGSGSVNTTWTPDARSGAAASEAWNAPGIPRVVNNTIVSGGSGSVTVTNLSSDWIAGTFRFDVVANPNNRDTANKTVEGSFELSFKERTIC